MTTAKTRSPRKLKAKKYDGLPLGIFSGDKAQQLQELYSQWENCMACPLHQQREHGIVFADGNPDADVMIIGEAPGEVEDQTGIPFVGDSGRLMNKLIAMTSDDSGIQELWKWFKPMKRASRQAETHFHEKMFEYRREQFFVTNIVACRPEDNVTPVAAWAKACWERVRNLIYIVDPILIISSGKVALETLTGKKMEITKKHGQIFEVEIRGNIAPIIYPVMATFHPAYLLRVADWNRKEGAWTSTIDEWRSAMTIVDVIRYQHFGTPMPIRMVDGTAYN